MAVKTDTQATTLPAQERKPQETIDSSSRGDIPLRWVTSILLLVFPTVTLFLNRGDSYVLGLLTLIGIWVWLRDGARRWLDRPSALLWIAFVLFFAVALLSYLLGTQTDAGFRFLGRYLRFLLIAPVYLALRRYPPTAKTMFIGLALGALAGGVVSLWHFLHVHHAIRIEATTDLSIIFGDLAATMVLCAAAGFGLMAASRRTWLVPLLILCLAGGVVATLLSGTRGAWLPLLFLIPMLAVSNTGIFRRRHIMLILTVVIALFFSSYFVTRTGTQIRLAQIGTDTHDFFLALSTQKSLPPQSSPTGRCVSGLRFLDAWVQLGSDGWGAPPTVTVQPDAALNRIQPVGLNCMADYAVKITNPDTHEIAQYVFPRVAESSNNRQHTYLLVRGKGAIYFSDNSGVRATFDTTAYRVSSLRLSPALGNYIVALVPPGKTVWLVPIDGFAGEYSMTIANTPIGQRFELWRAAWAMFLHHPLLGMGTGAYQDVLGELIQVGQIFPFVRSYDHPHSDYFNALASAGIVGFLTLLAILLVPLVRFWRALRGKDTVSHAVGLAGALTVLGFAIYALTDTIFLHSMMITWYVIYIALFYALLAAQAGKLAKPEPPKQ